MKKKIPRERVEELSAKWIKNKISKTEINEYDDWYTSYDDTVVDHMTEEQVAALEQNIYGRILHKRKRQQRTSIRLKPFLPYAACLVLFLAAYWLYPYLMPDPIVPGSNKLVLYSEGGSKFRIEDAEIGKEFKLGTSSFKKLDSSTLLLIGNGSSNGKVEYATIITPRGGEYKIQLEDGTKVWMNADSKLKVPSRFDKSLRTVELQGEAYFEVAHQAARPFVVETRLEKIKVLGTHFNVNAYAHAAQSFTSLTSGSVEVQSHATKQVALLRPGYQTVNSRASMAVRTFDMDEALAWRNGEFMFNEIMLGEALDKLGRWYDVEFVFESAKLKNKPIWGTLSRFDRFEDALNILRDANIAKFDVKGRRVVVTE